MERGCVCLVIHRGKNVSICTSKRHTDNERHKITENIVKTVEENEGLPGGILGENQEPEQVSDHPKQERRFKRDEHIFSKRSGLSSRQRMCFGERERDV